MKLIRGKLRLLFVLLFIASCKYEDGPLFSFSSPQQRVLGDYFVELATENGIEEMNKIDSLHIDALHFTLQENGPLGDQVFSVTFADTSHFNGNTWNLIDNNKQINIGNLGCYNPNATPPPIAPLPGFLTDGTCQVPYVTWEILKLSEKKMWLATNFNNIEYEVHLKEK